MRVMIDFDHWTEGDTLHRIRNLGEDFHERHVDAVMARVEKLIREHVFTATARVRRE